MLSPALERQGEGRGECRQTDNNNTDTGRIVIGDWGEAGGKIGNLLILITDLRKNFNPPQSWWKREAVIENKTSKLLYFQMLYFL